jgi:hypothetical protein
MYGVSPNGKHGGMRLCQVSGAGKVSWNGLGFPRLSIICGLVGEMMMPRSLWLGWGLLYGWAVALDFCGEALFMGDLLLALAEVGAGVSLAGDAALDLFAGDGLRPDTDAARLAGDFFFPEDSSWSTV